MNKEEIKKSNFFRKLFSKNKSAPKIEELKTEATETSSSTKTEVNFCNNLGSLLKKKDNKKEIIDQQEIDELLKPSPQLPMVKFDDDGDFFKENLPSKIFNYEEKIFYSSKKI